MNHDVEAMIVPDRRHDLTFLRLATFFQMQPGGLLEKQQHRVAFRTRNRLAFALDSVDLNSDFGELPGGHHLDQAGSLPQCVEQKILRDGVLLTLLFLGRNPDHFMIDGRDPHTLGDFALLLLLVGLEPFRHQAFDMR